MFQTTFSCMSTISSKSDKSTLGICLGSGGEYDSAEDTFTFHFFSSKFHSRISCVNTAARHDDLEEGVCVCVCQMIDPRHLNMRRCAD